MIVKVHTHRDGRILVTAVDSALIGKLFEEGELQLDLRSEFYQGEEKAADEVGDLVRNADMVELVGEQAVALGIAEEVIESDAVKRVNGVPFASAVLITD